MSMQQKKLGSDLRQYKSVVVGLRQSLKRTKVKEFREDIKAVLEFNRARVKWIEYQMGFTVLLFMCLCLLSCEPPVMANVSGYCDKECCCGVWATRGVNAAGERVTSSQRVIRPGDKFIAAPKHIPFGTMIDVPGYGKYSVEDRGGAIVGNCIDLYFCDKDGVSGHQRALNWGRQQLMVIIERKE